MTRAKRMARITRLAQTAEQIAAVELGKARGELARQRAQLAELRSYRADYARRLETGGITLGGYEAQQLRVFVQRVDEAVATLEARVEQAERRCDRERENWVRQRRKSDAYEDVTARAQRVEAGAAERGLQREIDDRGTRPNGADPA